MIKKQLATVISVALVGTLATSSVLAEEKKTVSAEEATMVKLIDALYENNSIDSKAYGALRLSAAGEQPVKKEKPLTPEEKKATAAKGAPANITFKNGFKMESADGDHSLELHGRIQADSYNTLSAGDNATTDRFDIRRAYLYTQGKLYKNWEYLFVGSFQGTPQMVFWEMNAHLWDEAQLKLGQYRFPFSINESTSSRNIDFMERALAMQFIPGIDRGAMLHGHPIQGLYYAVSGVNGGLRNNAGLKNSNIDETSDVDGKDFLGHVSYNAAPILGHTDSIYHFGVSGSFGQEPTKPGDANYQLRATTETNSLQFFHVDSFTNSSVNLSRVGATTVLAKGPLRFTGEYVNNDFTGSSTAGKHFDRNIDAYYLSGHWMLTGESYAKSFGKQNAFGDITPLRNFDMKGGLGAWELALRFSHMDASDFKAGNSVGTGVLSTGSANQADAYTVGLKWIINPQVRLLANYVHSDFNQTVTSNNTKVNSEDGLNFRTQINF